jgi:hypothetical protein
VLKELESHRNPHSPYQRFNYATLENIYDFIKTLGLFDDEEIKQIRKKSKTGATRTLLGEVLWIIFIKFLTASVKEGWKGVETSAKQAA